MSKTKKNNWLIKLLWSVVAIKVVELLVSQIFYILIQKLPKSYRLPKAFGNKASARAVFAGNKINLINIKK